MTQSLCLACGNIKFGALLPCKSCGSVPKDRRERAYSMLLSSHFQSPEQLQAWSREMQVEGLPFPTIDDPAEEAAMIDRFLPQGAAPA